MSSVAHKHTRSLEVIQQVDPPRTQDTRETREEHEGRDLVSYLSTSVYAGFRVLSIGWRALRSGKFNPCRSAENWEICGKNLEEVIRFVEKVSAVNKYNIIMFSL